MSEALFGDFVDTPDPLSEFTDPTVNATPALNSKQVANTGHTASIALSDAPTFAEAMAQSTDYMNQITQTYSDADIRREAAHKDFTQQIDALAALHVESKFDPDMQNAANLASANILAESQDQRAKYALEKLRAERIQQYVAAGDETMANTLTDLELKGDVLQRMRDNHTKQMIMDRAIDVATQDDEQKPWMSSVANFVLGSITGYTSWGSGELVDIDKHVKHWYDNLITGKTIEDQAGTLWSQIPVNEFSDYVNDHLLPAVRKHSTILGYHDQSKYLNTLMSLNSPKDIYITNAWDTVNNLAGVGAGLLTKAPLSVARSLVANGGRKMAAESIAKAVADTVEAGTIKAVESTGLTEGEIVANTLPTAVNPLTAREIALDAALKGKFSPDQLKAIAAQAEAKIAAKTKAREDAIDAALRDKFTREQLAVIKQAAEAKIAQKIAAGTKLTPREAAIDAALKSKFSTQELALIASRIESAALPEPPAAPVATSMTPVTPPTPGPISVVPLAGEVNESLARANAIVENLQIAQLGRLRPEEIVALDAKTTKALDEEFGANMVHDVDFEDVKFSDNTTTRRANFTVGSFSDEAEAQRFAHEYGMGELDPTQLIHDESGIWSVRVSRDVAEYGAYTNTLLPQVKGFLGRHLFGSRQVGDKWGNALGQAAFDSRGRVAAYMSDMYGKFIEKLPKASKELLDQITAQGNLRDMWFSRDQFNSIVAGATGRSATAPEWEAYLAHKEMNDVAHIVLNNNRAKNLIVKGYETVSFESLNFKHPPKNVNGRVVIKPTLGLRDRIFNATDNVYHGKNNPLTEDLIKKYNDEGYHVVNLDEAIELKDGTKVTSILVKAKDYTRQPLNRNQLPYKAGGRRMYQDGLHYAKQAVVGKQPDGDRYLAKPKVFIAGTKAEVDYWTTRVEAARQLVNRESGATVAELNKVLPKSYSGKQFLKDIETGAVQKDTPIRTMQDREVLPEYHANNDFHRLDEDLEESSVDGIMRTNGQLYYSGRGQILRDFEGQNALTLSPTKTINRALTNVASMSTFDDYKASMIERWYKTFAGSLDHPNVTPMQAFRDGTIKRAENEVIRQGAEAQRDVIKRALNWRGEFERQQEEYARRIGEFVMGEDPYSKRHQIGKDIVLWMDHTDPVQAIRGLATDLKLGLFNPGQFVLQLGTSVAAISMSPQHGMQGLASIYPLRSFLAKNGSEHTLNAWIAKGGHTAMGMAPDEFKAYMKQAKQGGFFEIGHNHVYLGDGGALNTNGKIRQAGRMFLTASEFANRAVANRIAWEEAKGVSKNFSSQPFQLALANGREKWSASMSSISGASWQRGLLSVPTQFWAYNARMLEMMFGKDFTTQQKVNLLVGQMLLYGSAGLPLAPLVSEQIKKHNGGAPDINSVGGVIDRGLFDAALYHLTGADVQVGKRIGTGSFVQDLPVVHSLIEAIFGASGYGDKSLPEVMGGVTGSIVGDGFETIKDLTKWAAVASSGETGGALTEATIKKVASNISTASNLIKAYSVFQYGTWISKNGSTQVNNLPSVDGFAALLGFAPGEVDDLSAKMLFVKDEGKLVDEYVNMYRGLQTRYANEPNNRADILEELSARTNLVDQSIRIKGQKKLRYNTSASVLESLTAQIDKDKALQQLDVDSNGPN